MSWTWRLNNRRSQIKKTTSRWEDFRSFFPSLPKKRPQEVPVLGEGCETRRLGAGEKRWEKIKASGSYQRGQNVLILLWGTDYMILQDCSFIFCFTKSYKISISASMPVFSTEVPASSHTSFRVVLATPKLLAFRPPSPPVRQAWTSQWTPQYRRIILSKKNNAIHKNTLQELRVENVASNLKRSGHFGICERYNCALRWHLGFNHSTCWAIVGLLQVRSILGQAISKVEAKNRDTKTTN